jgi:hypothetical protein
MVTTSYCLSTAHGNKDISFVLVNSFYMNSYELMVYFGHMILKGLSRNPLYNVTGAQLLVQEPPHL